ncbi:MAG: PAS domain-containing protein, partial [Herminiimonas sp.]|nr:PAS domain-containing protein [Herminiimonas sp.]
MSDPTTASVNLATTPCATSDGFRTDLLGKWLARLIVSADNGVLIVDSALRIVLINAEATRMFGYRPAELLDRPLESLLPERMRAAYAHDLARFAATRVAGRRLRIKLDLQGRRSDGEDFYVGTSLSRLIVNHETYLSIIVRELTVAQSPHAMLLGAPRLAGSSQQANEIEKRQFSRALYDDVGQCLSVLKLDLDWCERQLATGAV